MVFYGLIGVEHVAANLAAPFGGLFLSRGRERARKRNDCRFQASTRTRRNSYCDRPRDGCLRSHIREGITTTRAHRDTSARTSARPRDHQCIGTADGTRT